MEGIGQGITIAASGSTIWCPLHRRHYSHVEAMLDIHSPSKVFGRIGG
jgi:hypothetical protein